MCKFTRKELADYVKVDTKRGGSSCASLHEKSWQIMFKLTPKEAADMCKFPRKELAAYVKVDTKRGDSSCASLHEKSWQLMFKLTPKEAAAHMQIYTKMAGRLCLS